MLTALIRLRPTWFPDPDAATGTYVADGATYQVTDLPLEDWDGSSGGSSEDVTE